MQITLASSLRTGYCRVMENSILQAALKEEQQLIARLDAVRAVIRAYGGEPAGARVQIASEPTPRVAITRSPSETTRKIKALLVELLRGEASPIPTRDLLAFLLSKGIEVTGKNPVATLSALLSHANEFEPVGRSGWLLKSRTPDVAASGAVSADEVPASSIESQELTLRG